MIRILAAVAFAIVTTFCYAEEKKIYKDDCQHYVEIAWGTLIGREQRNMDADELMGYIRIYLVDSKIPEKRIEFLIREMREIWYSKYEIHLGVPEQLLKRCEERNKLYSEK
jgi:cellulose synthase/poly-beta-1,6-N-acetylglucosamine synthase-like glycosyltransferase